MKGRLIILVLLVATLQAGCSNSTKTPVELSRIEALKSPTALKISEIRLSGLIQTAQGLGAQAGLAWRSRQLNVMLNSQKRNLDNIFNFNYLILNQNVLPPVLVEGRNTLNLADEFTIRASDHDYQIVQPPRFVTAPPNWRDYIWMGYKKPETPNHTLLPQNNTERKAWNEYIQIGWNDGVNQANQIFSANLARLQRDYEGMILYRKLLAQNMLTPPYVSQADLGITGGGNDMRINDRVLRITAIPQLQANAKNWRPVISKHKQNQNPIFTPQTKTGKDKIK
ncbi:MAG: defect in organelle trafficking lipoprotein DotC [uncultured bacterium]|nr:MAG: defect in organelle trafficking lipoprotein DotC [uncultured bacterium]